MRLRAEYYTGPELKFLSNLDMMHLIERALRRAAIPYALSEGFNPHIKLSLGTVLPVGLWGIREYFDLELKENMLPQDFMAGLNKVLPDYMVVKNCLPIEEDEPSLMKILNAASYAFVVEQPVAYLEAWAAEFLNRSEITVKNKGKKKNQDKDIKPGIYKVELSQTADGSTISIWVSMGENLNIRFDELYDALEVTGIPKSDVKDIYRNGNYIRKESKFYSPLEKVT